MFHREVWAFLCLSIGLLIGGVYVGLPSRFVPLAADASDASRESTSASDAAIDGMRRFAETAVGLVRSEHAQETAAAALPLATASGSAMAPSTQPAAYSDVSNVPLKALKPADVDASAAMTRDIQAELARHGCYRGPVDGRWSASVINAVGAFNARANAKLPADGPDFALLSLARGMATPVCLSQVATTTPITAKPASAAPAVVPPVAVAPAAGTSPQPAADAPVAITTVRLKTDAQPVPGSMASAPTSANTRMSLGGQAPPAAAPAAPVTTAVVGAPATDSGAATTPANRDIHLFLHPLGQ